MVGQIESGTSALAAATPIECSASNMSISLLPSVATAHGTVTLITEQLDSPAEFLLHRALAVVLKEGTPCILVSSWNDLTHWSTIQSRSVSPEVAP
jgi:hypothetical protein